VQLNLSIKFEKQFVSCNVSVSTLTFGIEIEKGFILKTNTGNFILPQTDKFLGSAFLYNISTQSYFVQLFCTVSLCFTLMAKEYEKLLFKR
jgi:hypothetical protein